ncbi:hypothetical protein RUMLAC_01790 [[Ruminococcus] lactaris ATCC 29176]|uniref:Uncharacterized protein n=1 Tax=[Ruminococcus] lactaris ATCC 29176 TaxID=471875 RepID=B5CQP3_9FIRM|nr:hypothetical protein RUMLAC_01790 [[Ruminococcus] lactaris ATCC 29176]
MHFQIQSFFFQIFFYSFVTYLSMSDKLFFKKNNLCLFHTFS